jgi:Protein of unknown function (DUF3142)
MTIQFWEYSNCRLIHETTRKITNIGLCRLVDRFCGTIPPTSSMKTLRRPPTKIVFVSILSLTLVGAAFAWRRHRSDSGGSRLSASAMPAIILWAWERPEDLRFIDPETTAVAFLSKTVTLSGDSVIAKPRLQPLQLPAGVKVIPVVRIESDRKERPSLSVRQLDETTDQIRSVVAVSNRQTVQIDFDATFSQRQFYRSLLTKLRDSLPPDTHISITALASWCDGDNWLEDLPVNETVPMLFRMGVDRNSISYRLAGDGLSSTRCRDVAGISTDEPVAGLPRIARLYVFNPEPWTRESVKAVLETHQR